MKVSEIYGKEVESTSGKKGYVVSVNANGDRVECLICADENEREFAVDIVNIISAGEKIIYEDRSDAIKGSKPLRLGNAVFDDGGEFLGVIEDFTFSDGKLLSAKIGKKNYPAANLTFGDAVILKNGRSLKYDVKKNGKVIIKKGTLVTDDVLKTARAEGEYVQTALKSL